MIDSLLAVRERAAGSPVLEPARPHPRRLRSADPPSTQQRGRPGAPPRAPGVSWRRWRAGCLSCSPSTPAPAPGSRRRASTSAPPRWRLTEPLGYVDFVRLLSSARVVLTDSGGIQEETTVLGVPCVTLRDNTERPVTDRGRDERARRGTRRVARARSRARGLHNLTTASGTSRARSGRTRRMPAPPTRTRGSTARGTASRRSSPTSGTR